MKKITFLFMCLLSLGVAHAQYDSMAIVGDGTGVGGWPGEVNNPGPEDVFQMTSTDGIHWTYDNLTTFSGSVKFRAENSWDNNWGGATFPEGTGLFDSQTNNIPTVAGVYDVTFNSTTLLYAFELQTTTFPVISLTGPGVVGGDWGIDTDLSTTDGINYSISAVNLFGPVKFRQDHDWAINWAPLAFPSGTAVFDDPGSADAPEGTYSVTFNKNTLAYAFSTVAAVDKVAIAGFKAYPNPTQNEWNFSANDNIDSIQIMDVLGKTVLTIAPKNTDVRIDASNLNSGMYFAKVIANNATTTVKLLKN